MTKKSDSGLGRREHRTGASGRMETSQQRASLIGHSERRSLTTEKVSPPRKIEVEAALGKANRANFLLEFIRNRSKNPVVLPTIWGRVAGSVVSGQFRHLSLSGDSKRAHEGWLACKDEGWQKRADLRVLPVF